MLEMYHYKILNFLFLLKKKIDGFGVVTILSRNMTYAKFICLSLS